MTEENTSTSEPSAARMETEAPSGQPAAQDGGFMDKKAFAAQLEKMQSETPTDDSETEVPADNNTETQEASAPHDDDLDDDEMPERGAVPKSRFQKAIDKKNEYKTSAQAERDKNIVLQQQYDALQSALKQTFGDPEGVKQPAPPTNLDPIDPETTNALMKEINALKAKLEASEQKDNMKLAQTSFADTLTAQQKQFEEKTPDFKESWKHLIHQVYQEKLDLGFNSIDAEREAGMFLQQAAAQAVRVGKNAAEVLYGMSKIRGWNGAKVDSRKTGPDLNKISKNMEKSSGINDIAAANSGAKGYSADMIPQLAKKQGAFVDGAAFKKLLASVNNK